MSLHLLWCPGIASHHYLAFGNDVDPEGPSISDTHMGAADDCSHPPSCAGGVRNNALSLTVEANPAPPLGPYVVSIDGDGNLGELGALLASSAVVAGSGPSAPSPTPGSLVSHTGSGKGEVLLGSALDYARCDYGETNGGDVTCDKAVILKPGATSAGLNAAGVAWATAGIQPHSTSVGGSGGYTPEARPMGVATAHPQILSGSCTLAGHATCAFPSFAFGDMNYECSVTAQGTTELSDSYVKTSASEITIYTGSAISVEVSYICID